MKLNLGCGKKHKEGYINIDIQEPCDLKHDLSTPLPYEDNSVDEVYSEGNFVCLFSDNEWTKLKHEMVRVLKPGGKLEIIFLDFEYILKAFLENKDEERWSWKQAIFSGQANDYDFSKNGFTYEKMRVDLINEGMLDFTRKQTDKSDQIHLACYKRGSPQTAPKKMRILIGTPINQIKDYAMERWLENVAKLEYDADLLLVDNSPNLDYIKKIKGYCKRYGVNIVGEFKTSKEENVIYNSTKDCKIMHIEVNEFQPADEKIGRSREVIRQEVLDGGYDAWFSWHSDQIIPTNTLGKLIEIMDAGNYTMVHPNAWARETQGEPAADFGCCLIRKWALEKCGFTLEYSDEPNWTGNDIRFKKRVLKEGGNYIQIYGIISPIYHLNEKS